MVETEKSAPVLDMRTGAKPFLKWAGGKSQLLPQFEPHYPAALKLGKIKTYIEPFLGGGAVFLAVAQRYPIEQAYLTDINPELIGAYSAVKENPDALIAQLKQHQQAYDLRDETARSDYFYQVRAAYNAQRTQINIENYAADAEAWITRTAHMIFLNKTCFNGLFRVNAQGDFNVPFGRYKKPPICDADNLRRVSALLQKAELHIGPFTLCEQWVDADTFVYFDPPYRPISATSSFTAYSKNRFGDEQQKELADFFTHLHQQHGVKLMLSNSDPRPINPNDDFFDNLYKGFRVHRVFASRMINSQADKRGKISELLITNY